MDYVDKSDSNCRIILPVISRLESAMSAVVNGDGEKAKYICNNEGNIDLIVEAIKRYIDYGEYFESNQKLTSIRFLYLAMKQSALM